MISEKQRKILAFPFSSRYDALICDGAVRSGKTSIMMWAFVDWAMRNFDGCRFGICGKTVNSATQNIIIPFTSMTRAKAFYAMLWRRTDKILEVRRGGHVNYFEVFGGKDESSYALIQGRTLAGVLLDEVVLMPESFVNQAITRCSVSGSKLWFSCNPGNPGHWFYKEWIQNSGAHNALYLHFAMTDNPSLDDKTLARYKTSFAGVFYRRYVLGEWVAGDGVIYDMFSRRENVYSDETRPISLRWNASRAIACDYGTTNPMRFLDIFDTGGKIYIDREYDWDSRKTHRQKTDQEYADDLQAFMGNDPQFQCPVIVDPSAASFIAELKSRGVFVIAADNEVLDGIRKTSTLFHKRQLLVHESCKRFLEEVGTYSWDQKAAERGEDAPVKLSDHSMDATRYYINSLPSWRFQGGLENVETAS